MAKRRQKAGAILNALKNQTRDEGLDFLVKVLRRHEITTLEHVCKEAS